MLEGCTPYPAEVAERYRRDGNWLGLTMGQVLDKAAAEFGERQALSYGDRRYSYAEVQRAANHLAYHFAKLGLEPLDRVVMQLPNIPEFVFAFFALMKIGVIPVMALRPHRHNEIRHFLAHSGARGYFIPDRIRDFDYRDMAAEMQAENPILEHVIVAGEPDTGQVSIAELLAKPLGQDHQALLDARSPDPGEVALMLLSGGTTALPKLIPRSHDDYVCGFRLCGAVAEIGPRTVYLVLLPMAHNYTLASPGVLGVLWQGGRVVLAPEIDPATVFGLIESEGVTMTSAAVPVITGWLKSGIADDFDLSSLEVLQNGGARLQTELRRQVRELMGCRFQESYGTAEGLVNLVPLDADDEYVLESSGTPAGAANQIKVVDDQGNEVLVFTCDHPMVTENASV